MRVQLFSTCLIDTFHPETKAAVLKLLSRFGCEVVIPKERTCCGKPASGGGYDRVARKAAEHFISVFGGGSDPIVIPSGSCASMVKNHYPDLFGDDAIMRQRAVDVGNRVYELSQFLVHVLKAHEKGFTGSGRITYHSSCQLIRELGVRDEPLQLLRAVKGIDFKPLPHADRCCGFGGIFMARLPEVSMAMADEKLENILETGADTVTGCDHGCLMNIADAVRRNGAGVNVKHLAVVLAEGLR
jgi:L-lactate dehydrogenase complex protein LldE